MSMSDDFLGGERHFSRFNCTLKYAGYRLGGKMMGAIPSRS
jgi:hypothetical protein